MPSAPCLAHGKPVALTPFRDQFPSSRLNIFTDAKIARLHLFSPGAAGTTANHESNTHPGFLALINSGELIKKWNLF